MEKDKDDHDYLCYSILSLKPVRAIRQEKEIKKIQEEMKKSNSQFADNIILYLEAPQITTEDSRINNKFNIVTG